MLKSEVIDFTTKTRFNVSYFDDDTIQTVRHQIAIAMNTHPDRLFILVSLNLNNDYYQKDPRRWEALFDRLSYNGSPLEKEPFQAYQLQYKSPASNAEFMTYDKSEWMNKPESLQDIYSPTRDFSELRIFGVEEHKSYVLPFEYNGPLVSRIPSANLPLPENDKLVSNLYDSKTIGRFIVIPYSEEAESVQLQYFPFIRATTPPRVSDETVQLLTKNAKLLSDLMSMKISQPINTSVTRVRLYAKFVTTDMGSAVRTRFEQIFYGITLSKEVPYVGYFTSNSEYTRHKFYTEDSKNKKPYLDMTMWSRWHSRKLGRNRPTLIFYRGESRENRDRIVVTEDDIVITLYREEGNNEKIPEMKKSALKWLRSFDAVMAFVDKEDIESDRWEVQELALSLKYPNEIDEYDLRRFNCLTSIFDQPDKSLAKFTLLRTDKSNYGISTAEMTIIQMMKEGEVKVEDISEQLNIPLPDARALLTQVESKIEEDPSILDRAFRGYPSMLLGRDMISVSFVNEVDRIVKYASILRYVLSATSSKTLDAICPKRMETTRIDTGIAPVENVQIDEDLRDRYDDLFSFGDTTEEPTVTAEEAPKERKVSAAQKKMSRYSYFKDRLEKFDSNTFDDTSYPKVCEHNYQPIIIGADDLQYFEGLDYDPQKLPDNQKLYTENPDGVIICPEYWCMKDEIPLTEEQLDKSEGQIRCPVCGNKLRVSESDDIREYTVIKRTSGYIYPKLKKDKAPKSGKNMPCCFKTPDTKKKTEPADQKYYIVRENILQIDELRISYLPKKLLDSLQIKEDYAVLGKSNRMQNGMSGFFRVGLGRPSKTLPELLNLSSKIPSPRESVETVLKCSFLRTWKVMGETYLSEIESHLRKINPFDTEDVSRQHLAKLISGIDEAYSKKTLSVMEELEYCSLALQCDVFRVFSDSNTLGCLFYSPMVRPRSRGIVILQKNNVIDILSHVTRLPRGFQYKSNIFEIPFKKETYSTLEKTRNQACKTPNPSYNEALTIVREALIMASKEDFEVILDPYGRGQAFYIPGHAIFPFQPVPLPSMSQTRLGGYDAIPTDSLPRYETLRQFLSVAEGLVDGYAWVEDLYDNEGRRVEILLKSGLRVPVYPEKSEIKETSEVIQTTNEIGEEQLTFGAPSGEIEEKYKQISYASEVYDFLIYQLTKDLKEKYTDLRKALLEVSPKHKIVEPLLKTWFEENTDFVASSQPIEFLSKVRTPCGQFKSKDTCSGNLCGWNGKTCNIQINNSLRKDRLFHRLLSTLLENSKIRAMVLDGRTSPFFSTVLYLELPNEVIYSDLDIVNITV